MTYVRGRTKVRASWIVAVACLATVGIAGCSVSTAPVPDSPPATQAPLADSSSATQVDPTQASPTQTSPTQTSPTQTSPTQVEPTPTPSAIGSSDASHAVAVVHAERACAAADVVVTVVGGDGAGGSAQAVLRFRNVAPTACWLRGYPAVVAVDASHHASIAATHSLDALFGGTAKVAEIAVAPGGTASATLEWTDNPVGNGTSCAAYPTIEITPPGTRHRVDLRMPIPVRGCSAVSVLPVVAGARGTVST